MPDPAPEDMLSVASLLSTIAQQNRLIIQLLQRQPDVLGIPTPLQGALPAAPANVPAAPVSASQIRTVSSDDPEKIQPPSGENATYNTAPGCPIAPAGTTDAPNPVTNEAEQSSDVIPVVAETVQDGTPLASADAGASPKPETDNSVVASTADAPVTPTPISQAPQPQETSTPSPTPLPSSANVPEPQAQETEDAPVDVSAWGVEANNDWGSPANDTPPVPAPAPAAAPARDYARDTSRGSSRPAKQAPGGKNCSFGWNCNWFPNCRFQHPERSEHAYESEPRATYEATQSARFSEGRPTWEQRSNQTENDLHNACRFAMDCTRTNCYYQHPPGWNPPTSTEPIPEQQSSTWETDPYGGQSAEPLAEDTQAPASDEWDTNTIVPANVAANNDWGTDESTDYGRWGIEPNNDWGTPANDGWGTAAIIPPSASPASIAQPNVVAPKPEKTPEERQRKAEQRKRAKARKAGRLSTDDGSTVSSTRSPSTIPAPPSEAATDVHDSTVDSLSVLESPEAAEEFSTNDSLVDVLDTPPLEPTGTSSSPPSPSEPDAPATPPFTWSDEPCIVATSSLDQSHETSEVCEQALFPETTEEVVFEEVAEEIVAEENTFSADSNDLDETAPSLVYSSWAPPEDTGWGDAPTEQMGGKYGTWGVGGPSRNDDQAGQTSNKPSAKAQGKRKEAAQAKTPQVPRGKNKNGPAGAPAPPKADTSASSHQPVSASISEQAPVPKPLPQGVPDDEIADWLLGVGEDSHAVLGLTRTSEPTPVPARSASGHADKSRVKLQQMPASSFPPLQSSSNYQPPTTSVASGATIQPKRRGFRIISSSSTPASTPAPDSSPSGQRNKRNSYRNK